MESDCSLQEASNTYQTLASFLSEVKIDATDFVCGNNIPFPEHVKEDLVSKSLLISYHKSDNVTVTVLQNLFTAWEAILLKAAAEHLQGGKFAVIEGRMDEETQSVPRHNKFPERVFALLDALTRFRPVATTLCNEAYILFSLNKTYNWLYNLPKEERDEYINRARAGGRELRLKYRERTKEIETAHQLSLKKKRDDILRKKAKDLQEKETVINYVQYWGFWQYPETLKQNLKKLKSIAEKKKALKAQLRFRKVILCQEHLDKKNVFVQRKRQRILS